MTAVAIWFLIGSPLTLLGTIFLLVAAREDAAKERENAWLREENDALRRRLRYR